MRDVPSVNHKGRLRRQRLDLDDGLLERADHIGIGRLVEADVTIAYLQKIELARLSSERPVDDSDRPGHTPRDRPQNACPRPRHAFQYFPPAHAEMVLTFAHDPAPHRFWLDATQTLRRQFIP